MPLCVASRDSERSRPAVSQAHAFDSCHLDSHTSRRFLPASALSLESGTGLSLSVPDLEQRFRLLHV